MTGQASSLDWLISVDDHILEPPNVWQDRLPARYQETGPRLIRADGDEYWAYEDKRIRTSGLSAVVGKAKDQFSPEPISYEEMAPGCYDAAARLEDMNRAGIIASLSFPSFPRFCGQIFLEAKDKDLALACVKAYNDWMVEEWCATAPDRFIPLTLIPLWDPRLAVKEMERNAARGVHAFAFSENPEPLGLPTINDPDGFWNPVMEAANEMGMVVCMHVGSSSTLPAISKDAPFMANLSYGAVRTAGTMLAWLFSGVLQRLPNLKIALSEGEIGWIPYFLERAQQVYDKQRFWVARGVKFRSGSAGLRPDEGAATNTALLEALDIHQLYLEHVYGCFIDDIHGLNSLDVIGENNVMIETDYPHSDTTWPDSIKLARERLGHLPVDVQQKIVRGNAERLFQFRAATAP
jgi:predicted TIM-barrel fold metal-dependent hydrolase